MSTEATVAECLCPDSATHPDGETIGFREKLDFRTLASARWAIEWAKSEDRGEVGEIMGMLTEFYLLHCIESWTLKDGKKPLELTKDNIRDRILTRPDVAFQLGDVADSLYSQDVILPLVRRAASSSATSLNGASTSATNGNGKSPKHSKRSLTSTTRTVATAETRR